MVTGKALTIGFAALAAITMAAQDAVPIQRTLVANAVETYKATSKATETLSSPLGDFPINISTNTTYTLKTNKVDTDKGVADVDFTSKIDSIDGGDSPLTEGLSKKKPDPIVQHGTLDKFAHLDLKSPDNADKEMMIFAGVSGSLQPLVLVQLPDHPVKVGDSWDIPVAKSDYTAADQKVTAKLTGDKKVDGKDVWTVDLSGTVNIDFDSDKVQATSDSGGGIFAKHHITATGTAAMKGTAYIEKATGKTINLDGSSDLTTNISLDGDTKGKATGALITTLKLDNTPG